MNKFFIHIPKTAGTSIKTAVPEAIPQRTNKYKGHEPLFYLEQNNDLSNQYIFCVVRNPYDRALSYYKHFNRVNNFNYSFKEFLYIVMSKGSLLMTEYLHHNSHSSLMWQTPMIFFDQSFYIKSFKNNKVNIFKLEQISILEDFLKIKLPVENKSPIINIEYDSETRELVKHIYKDDFVNFNYSA